MMEGFWAAIAASFVSMVVLLVILLALLYLVGRLQLHRDLRRYRPDCRRCHMAPPAPGERYCLGCLATMIEIERPV